LLTPSRRPSSEVVTPSRPTASGRSPWIGRASGWPRSASSRQPARSTFDREQLWTVLAGELTITVEDASTELAVGDTIVIPTAAERQVHARTAARLIVCGPGDAVVTVPGEEAQRGTPPWIA
jgi:mannose-6-phosphate isomerase-like protein (cupin superfamily)